MAKTPQVAVLLSGCGHLDGAEIREAVLTLLALDQHGAKAHCIAPNAPQHHVVNHLDGQEQPVSRNILEEAARIARGEILDLAKAKVADYDALVMPGGFGVAKNHCSFAFKGAEAEVRPDVAAFVGAFLDAKKPVGAVQKLGSTHERHDSAREIAVDEALKIITTPAYMFGDARVSDVFTGIDRLVAEVLKRC